MNPMHPWLGRAMTDREVAEIKAQDSGRYTAIAAMDVLRRMMKELAADNWPSEETWADACRLLGRPVPAPLAAVTGPGVPIDTLMNTPAREFTPPRKQEN